MEARQERSCATGTSGSGRLDYADPSSHADDSPGLPESPESPGRRRWIRAAAATGGVLALGACGSEASGLPTEPRAPVAAPLAAAWRAWNGTEQAWHLPPLQPWAAAVRAWRGRLAAAPDLVSQLLAFASTHRAGAG